MSATVVTTSGGVDHAVVRACQELAEALVAGTPVHDRTGRLEAAAARWARAGVPLEWVHEQLGKSLNYPKRPGAGAQDVEEREFAVFTARLTAVLATVSKAYLTEKHSCLPSRSRLVSALLTGDDGTALARECAVVLAPRYAVIAVALPGYGEPHASGTRVATRIEMELARRCGSAGLSRLSGSDGTILVPEPLEESVLDRLLEDLSAAARVPLTAATVSAARPELADAACRAHDLLEIAVLLGQPGTLHRFRDLAAEYQLTRPGPARDQLAGVLDPLDGAPHLMLTLRLHLCGTYGRRAIARRLGIHANTVEYRLKRIASLTGLDPFTVPGQWKLRCALTARSRPAIPSA
ncbi:helix-turn-helix domain-containing protein [Nocardia sp. BSTN01]|uniref:PucR family transcriptional regulator n=1 Tax=Nocardia sp. BSTN01 TaxID=2783665 RepID=UPI00188FC627|nr:helix-turn-helix domain-containing protein [Nocardia sp. BSTN01]MBF4999621.1 helix-turn-helix domain-containing protein [Nocardia sp. BSTN01]